MQVVTLHIFVKVYTASSYENNVSRFEKGGKFLVVLPKSLQDEV